MDGLLCKTQLAVAAKPLNLLFILTLLDAPSVAGRWATGTILVTLYFP